MVISKCSDCNRSDLMPKICVCHGTAYCNVTCQRAHWKKHKSKHKDRMRFKELSEVANASHVTEIPGVPIASGKTEGFLGLGKLRGSHRCLWRAACLALVDSILQGCNDEINNDLPLFTMLSPHHRVRLLCNVAVGLLCDEAPPPPESIWHYAAYFAPLHYAFFVLISIECDFEFQKRSDMEEEVCNKLYEKQAVAEGEGDASEKIISLNEKHAITEGEGDASEKRIRDEKWIEDCAHGEIRKSTLMAELEHANRERKANRTETKDLVSEIEQRRGSDGAISEHEMKETMTRMVQGNTSVSKEETRIQMELMQRDPHAFIWRRLVLAFLKENSIFAKVYDAVPNLGESDCIVWGEAYRMMMGSLIVWPENKEDLFSNILFQPLDRKNDLVRDDLIHREVRRSMKKFHMSWDPQESALDFRILITLKDSVHDPSESDFLEEVERLCNIESQRKLANLCFNILKFSREEAIKRSLQSKIPAYQVERDIGKGFAWSWSHHWHLAMQNSHRNYQSPSDRISAILEVKDLVSSGCATDPLLVKAWSIAPFYDVDVDIFNDRPPQSLRNEIEITCEGCRKSHFYQNGIDLLTCSRCEVVKYCSKKCQKSNHKIHKRVCKSMKMIAVNGEGAALLPEKIFHETMKKKILQNEIDAREYIKEFIETME